MRTTQGIFAVILLTTNLVGHSTAQLGPKTPPVTPRQTQPIDVPKVIVAGGNGARHAAARSTPPRPAIKLQQVTPAMTQAILQTVKGKSATPGDVPAPSFVTLTPRRPYVTDKGYLQFDQPVFVLTEAGEAGQFDQYASFNLPGDPYPGDVQIMLKPDHAGQNFLVSLSVMPFPPILSKTPPDKSFELSLPDGKAEIVQVTLQGNTISPLFVFFTAQNTNWQQIRISHNAGFWEFFSCDVKTVQL